jgi:hypothetical protein
MCPTRKPTFGRLPPEGTEAHQCATKKPQSLRERVTTAVHQMQRHLSRFFSHFPTAIMLTEPDPGRAVGWISFRARPGHSNQAQP